MHFLPIQELPVKDGTGYEGFAFARNGESAYALCDWTETGCGGMEAWVGLAMSIYVDSQVTGNGNGLLAGMVGQGTSEDGRARIDLFF
jgi:hypothetical protein